MWNYNFYVYIVTNTTKDVLYVGVTNDICARLYQHTENAGNKNSFAGKYYCHYLVHYQHYMHVEEAIAREKEIKKWRREKKVKLIESTNPDWRFLNKDVCE